MGEGLALQTEVTGCYLSAGVASNGLYFLLWQTHRKRKGGKRKRKERKKVKKKSKGHRYHALIHQVIAHPHRCSCRRCRRSHPSKTGQTLHRSRRRQSRVRGGRRSHLPRPRCPRPGGGRPAAHPDAESGRPHLPHALLFLLGAGGLLVVLGGVLVAVLRRVLLGGVLLGGIGVLLWVGVVFVAVLGLGGVGSVGSLRGGARGGAELAIAGLGGGGGGPVGGGGAGLVAGGGTGRGRRLAIGLGGSVGAIPLGATGVEVHEVPLLVAVIELGLPAIGHARRRGGWHVCSGVEVIVQMMWLR
ncbi:hypothetical protein BO70DRAFT_226728 [Aspergillus heteromorphus CBS 117.55]|uniref:Uncharacterized protein n=1 Tax=Aspergillus heteromorphus CBS 117.55 TaxID=1448321 RepID=A0A317WE95_9EURO|nr:uncharacterized protein BO70DRAFT_226728 [Aspergillus heteromorphus CBS 117.55]PWY84744.1 hypothetical protein BO70DRAFT_226728 [Aspergillus heteromorphus CBS 117.55]